MSFNPKRIIIAAGIAALSLSAVGCNGQVPGNAGYVPTSTSSTSLVQSSSGVDRFHKKKGEITSNCSRRLHLVVAGLVDCKFNENGYNGDFSVANDTKGIVLVTPSSGAQSTTFTIVGLVIGSGKLVWSDGKGNKFTMKVKVTL